ncbi:MAG: tetratricopeptide (TPR) repeat protein [Flavobacteriales bacterium]|jgi:tetratricopeptide (TPR) repeat protein
MEFYNHDNYEEDEFEIFFDVGEIEEQLAKVSPDDTLCYSYVKLGKLYSKAHRYDEAIEYYNLAIAMNPVEQGFQYYRGIALFHLGKYAEAMSDFSAILSSDPWNKWDVLNFTGTIKLRTGDHDGALEDIEQVLDKNNGLLNDLRISMEEYDLLMLSTKLRD